MSVGWSPISITMGDPAGIGPEICLKAVAGRPVGAWPVVIVGDHEVLERTSHQAELSLPLTGSSWEEAAELAALHGAAVFHVQELSGAWSPRIVNENTGRAAYRYIETAIELTLAGKAAAVVTGPIHKEALRAAGVPYPGHTEIFAALTDARRACMMLTSEALTCSFVTTHVGLRDVAELVTLERVLDVIQLTHDALLRMCQRPPHIAVCGLNPHAGEGGLFGNREEERVTIPAMELAVARGISLQGPLPADTAFLPARRKVTDGYVCMYHDQGHIPLKALSFETAVNTTLGLPIIRTSVDHGTALDIAWRTFEADPTSMLRAITLAERLAGDGMQSSVDQQQTKNDPQQDFLRDNMLETQA